MTEGWAQHLKDKVIEPYSAGIIARGLNPRAVAVMKETGIDISHLSSKDVGVCDGYSFRSRDHRV